MVMAMRNLMAGCAALLAVGPAAAEDVFAIPPAAVPPAAMPPAATSQAAPHSWTGFYGGLNAGGASGGVTGGGQAGTNWQFGRAVIGVEGDFGRKGGSSLDPGQAGSWEGSARGRAGIASDQLLIYGTGGAAFGSGRR